MSRLKTNITDQHVKFVNKYIETEDAYAAARFAGVKKDKLDSTVARWREHPTILAMIEQQKLAAKTGDGVTIDWIAGEIEDIYQEARSNDDLDKAMKAMDMLAKHKGFYAADKGKTDAPVTVVITNYAGAKIETNS
jgi:phage terminase small subunit